MGIVFSNMKSPSHECNMTFWSLTNYSDFPTDDTAWWIFMKLGIDEVLKVPYKCCCFRLGAYPGRGENRSQGVPFFKELFFRPEGYSNKPNA